MAKAPDPIDKHVGSRVRMRRMMIGMSQERLGEALGLTFQQVQKYEKGTNRIGASRLHQIAAALGVGVAFFYEGAPAPQALPSDAAASPPEVADFLASAEGLHLMRAFVRLKDARVRRRIVDLIAALADDEVE